MVSRQYNMYMRQNGQDVEKCDFMDIKLRIFEYKQAGGSSRFYFWYRSVSYIVQGKSPRIDILY